MTDRISEIETTAIARRQDLATRQQRDQERLYTRGERLVGTGYLMPILENREIIKSAKAITNSSKGMSWTTTSRAGGGELAEIYNTHGPAVILGPAPDKLGSYQIAAFDIADCYQIRRGGDPPKGYNNRIVARLFHVPEVWLDEYMRNPSMMLGDNHEVFRAASFFAFNSDDVNQDEICREMFSRTSHRKFSPVKGIKRALYLQEVQERLDHLQHMVSLSELALQDADLNPVLHQRWLQAQAGSQHEITTESV